MRTRITITCLVLCIAAFYSDRLIAASTNTASIAVLVSFDKGGIQYEVDSKPVRSDKILEVLGGTKRERSRGRETPVVVLIDNRNSMAALSNIRGIIDKAGFSTVRYFYFTADRQRMAEIILNQPAIPFSLDPETPKQ